MAPDGRQALPADPVGAVRLRVRVAGQVQGVGFRPFVYRLALRLRLTGWVRNDAAGVEMEVQGERLGEFLTALRSEAPPLARIDSVVAEALAGRPEEDSFTITASGAGAARTAVTPDIGVCPDCLRELFDPDDRRHLYPFLNCTNCGPRYTITRHLPYDRAHTAMARFVLCDDCDREYHDPLDRRFHAQPTACPACGPSLRLPVPQIVARLRRGEIVAIKGLGGFHLACDARNEEAVARLRLRKQREEKPFALMVANLATARRLAEIGRTEAALLEAPSRPIVLLRRHADVGEGEGGAMGEGLAPSVAPGLRWLGLMLPYTPLHYLLFHEAAGRPEGLAWLDQPQELVLVMTSANPGGEPLVTDDDEATARLAGIADAIAGHNRPIVIRADDSVMRVIGGAPAFLRRARGFVPEAIRLPRPVRPILAVGAMLKNTICITRGDEAFVSQHIGDLDNAKTIRFFDDMVAHLLAILEVTPELVAHDLHPDLHASRYATRFAAARGLPAVAVQHHHAHIAGVLAEHRVAGAAIGLALDGIGLGPDNQVWGGELLRVSGGNCLRIGHLATLALPGGDAAARQPWRMGAAVFDRLGRGAEIPQRWADQPGSRVIAELLQKRVNARETSSCGRLFDAACGLLGVQPWASFEGQAAMRLEGLVTRPEAMAGGWRIVDGVLDFLPVLERLIDCDPETGANLFHGTLIAGLTEWVARAATKSGDRVVALAGGCFQNEVLTEGLLRTLSERGLQPLLPRRLPANDGGLSLGQAWVAAQTEPGAHSVPVPTDPGGYRRPPLRD